MEPTYSPTSHILIPYNQYYPNDKADVRNCEVAETLASLNPLKPKLV
jgi:hypothetical protein